MVIHPVGVPPFVRKTALVAASVVVESATVMNLGLVMLVIVWRTLVISVFMASVPAESASALTSGFMGNTATCYDAREIALTTVSVTTEHANASERGHPRVAGVVSIAPN